MTHDTETRAVAYRRILAGDLYEPDDVRRAKRVPVRMEAPLGPSEDWLTTFETELDDALDDYEAARADGRETAQLAGYIAYLCACVSKLWSDPRRARASLDRSSSLR